MGYKIPACENKNLARLFQSEFVELDYFPTRTVRSSAEILDSIERAAKILARHGIKIRKGGSSNLASSSGRF